MVVWSVTEIDPVKLPPLGVMVGVATVGAAFTVKLKVVVLVIPPPVAVTVIVEVAAGVARVVLIVSVEVQAGLQLAEEREGVAPDGKPATEKATT